MVSTDSSAKSATDVRSFSQAMPSTSAAGSVSLGAGPRWRRSGRSSAAARPRAAADDLPLRRQRGPAPRETLPAADVEGMAWLKERTSVALFADESVLTIDELDAVAELYDGVVVKLSKAGGIASAFALVSACTGRGLRVLLGCMVESSLGIAAGLQLAGLADHVDLDGALLLADDPFTGIAVEGDLLTASNEPGLRGHCST